MEKINELIKEITLISDRLNVLACDYGDVYQQYTGTEFDNQTQCSVEIENLTIQLTHEISSQIGFGVSNLKLVLAYIDFRKKHQEFTDAECLMIIDQDHLNIRQKLALTQQKKEKDLTAIISDWNTTFKNIGYEKLKHKIGLKTP